MKFSFTATLFGIILSITLQSNVNAQVKKSDSLTLVDLYNSTNGINWRNHSNWLTASPVSTWFGVTVSNGRVAALSLYNNNLSGSIPSSIGNLTHLQGLFLSLNAITGSIPSTIGNLINLKEIDLEENQITGSLPASIGNLTNLTDLLLRYNKISGSLPDSICYLINLINLDLFFNNLDGTIPSAIGNLVNLGYLNLSQNQISGTIPASVVNLTHLRTLDFSRNKLTGEIPSLIGNLEYLQVLALFNNQLSGHIPESIGNFKLIKDLYLDSNRLTGGLPASISKLNDFSTLGISNNLLSQKENTTSPDGFQIFIEVNMENNRFNFNGIEGLAKADALVNYSPQRKIHLQSSGNSLHVNAGGTLSNNTYTWYKSGETTGVTIVGDSIFHPTENGSYYVTVTNAIATRLTLVSDTVSYTSTLTGARQNDSKAASENRFTVYPNPAKNQVYVQLSKASELFFIDANGKTLFTKYVDEKSTIDISNLAAGNYYIKNKLTGEIKKLQVVK